jgi:hypothetical protein
MTEHATDLRLRFVHPRNPEQHRDARRFFIERSFFEHAVITSHLAVIGRERNDRVVELTGFFKDVEHSADRVVDDLDVAKVLRSKLAPTRFLA